MNPEQSPYMLVVEDSNEDFEALQRILAKDCKREIFLRRCIDGDDALDFIYDQKNNTGHRHLPSLIILDLNLPGTDGYEVIAQLKQDDQLKKIPIIVLTTSSSPKDIETCYQHGVNSYLVKPIDIGELKTSLCTFVKYWFEVAVLPINTHQVQPGQSRRRFSS